MAEIKELGMNEIEQAYDGWYYTVWCNVKNEDQNELIQAIESSLLREDCGTPKQWFKASGEAINQKFGLDGSYIKEDAEFLMFDYEGMNVGKLALFKLAMKDRWFTDIIDNARRDLGYDEYSEEGDEE